jgi:hypothetical protein
MPLGYKASLANASWRWEYLGGAFARYVQRDDLWWAFGVFADVGPDDDTYLPYAGVSWDITDQWTLSAIMPWPAVLYAPDRDTLVRLGASPSGAAWSLGSGADKVGYELASWDLGVTAEHRMTGNFWVGLKAGVGGLRTLRMTGSDWIGPEVDLGSSPYIGLGISYRPELLD